MYREEVSSVIPRTMEKHLMELIVPALGKKIQTDPWGSLGSQPYFLGEL